MMYIQYFYFVSERGRGFIILMSISAALNFVLAVPCAILFRKIWKQRKDALTKGEGNISCKY